MNSSLAIESVLDWVTVEKKCGKCLYYLWDGLATITHENRYLYARYILLVHMCCKPHTDSGAKDPVSGQNDSKVRQ